MQYLKDEIKRRILSSALKEFNEKGFGDASMRQIAADADIAIGNVYRYFKSKEELFCEIVEPVYRNFMMTIENHGFTSGRTGSFFETVVDYIMPFFKENKTQLLLLMDKSKGTIFESAKKEFIKATEHELVEHLMPAIEKRGVSISNKYIFYVIASTFLEGIFIVLREYEDENEIRYLVHELLTVSFSDIDKRFV